MTKNGKCTLCKMRANRLQRFPITASPRDEDRAIGVVDHTACNAPQDEPLETVQSTRADYYQVDSLFVCIIRDGSHRRTNALLQGTSHPDSRLLCHGSCFPRHLLA